MPGIGLWQEWRRDACPSIQRARLSAVVKVVHGLLGGGRLRLTERGRGLPTTAFVNHNIQCVDRRLGTATYRWQVINALPPMRRTKERGEAEAFLREITA